MILKTDYPHFTSAAFFAIAARCFAVSFAARAFPPTLPLLTLPDGSGDSSSNSPVAILATIIAQPMISAGRFCPYGPLGILLPFRPFCFDYFSFKATPSQGGKSVSYRYFCKVVVMKSITHHRMLAFYASIDAKLVGV